MQSLQRLFPFHAKFAKIKFHNHLNIAMYTDYIHDILTSFVWRSPSNASTLSSRVFRILFCTRIRNWSLFLAVTSRAKVKTYQILKSLDLTRFKNHSRQSWMSFDSFENHHSSNLTQNHNSRINYSNDSEHNKGITKITLYICLFPIPLSPLTCWHRNMIRLFTKMKCGYLTIKHTQYPPKQKYN